MADKLTKEGIAEEYKDLPEMTGEDHWITIGTLCYEFAEGIAEGLYTNEEAIEIAKQLTEPPL